MPSPRRQAPQNADPRTEGTNDMTRAVFSMNHSHVSADDDVHDVGEPTIMVTTTAESTMR
jgi:hypothetical protein